MVAPQRPPPAGPAPQWSGPQVSRPLLLGGMAALILIVAVVLTVVVLRSQAGSSGERADTGQPTAAPHLLPSELVLVLSDLPGYMVRPTDSPSSNSATTAESRFQSSGPPARIVNSLADVSYNDQSAAEQYQSVRNAHLAGKLQETAAPALGQSASMFKNEQTSVLLWREGSVVCQISASATVTNEELVMLGQKQDARVRTALKGR
jgi:hypothetical protein